MPDDIFGDPQDEPDISTEGLAWEPDDSNQIAVADEPLQSDEGDAGEEPTADAGGDEADPGPDEDDAADAEDKGDEAPAADAGNDDLPDYLKGKSPAELAKIIADSQAFITQQGAEIGTLRQAVEQIQQAQQQQGYVPAAEYISTAEDGLIAYREGIAMLDRGEIGPAALDEIIDTVRDLDPAVAAKMDRDFGMRLARAEMSAQMAPVMQQSYQASLERATAQVNADPDAEAYREDIVRIVQQPATVLEQQIAHAYANAQSADQIAGALSAALTAARGANPVKSLTYKQQLEAAKQNEQVEAGNSSPPPKSVSEADAIRNSLLAGNEAEVNLFASFGA